MVLLSYSLGVVHTFIGHNHDSSDEANFCHTPSINVDECGIEKNAHFEHKGHCDPNLYDFLSCILGQIQHAESVNLLEESREEVLLKVPKEIREVTAFLMVVLQPIYVEQKVNSVSINHILTSLIPHFVFGKRGPPSLL